MGRKPRLLSCSMAWPHRRHERLPSTQNSCTRNEGKLLLLLKLRDAFLSFLALCYCNTSKTIQASFLCVSFGSVAKERMCFCLCACNLCLCASLFVCVWLIALMYCLQLWYRPTMPSNRHTQSHTAYFSSLVPVVKTLEPTSVSPLTLSDPLPTFRFSSTQSATTPSGPHQSVNPHFLNYLRNFPGWYSCFICQDSTLCPQSTSLPCVCVCARDRVEYTSPSLNIHTARSLATQTPKPSTLLKPEWSCTDS